MCRFESLVLQRLCFGHCSLFGRAECIFCRVVLYLLYIVYQFLLHNHIIGCVSRSGFKLKILLPCFILFYNNSDVLLKIF